MISIQISLNNTENALIPASYGKLKEVSISFHTGNIVRVNFRTIRQGIVTHYKYLKIANPLFIQ